jgi:hypothetical protein
MPGAADRPRQALLFSGHMLDAPGRAVPRFPPSMEPAARDAITRQLDDLQAGPGDIAVCSGACGGDLLFAEAVLARGLRLEVYLPFDAETFAMASVDFAGGHWRSRYDAVLAAARVHLMSAERAPLPPGQDAYEATNLWMLEAAQGAQARQTVFICLWNGEGGDGPGGTQHMMDLVRQQQGEVRWIDTRLLGR